MSWGVATSWLKALSLVMPPARMPLPPPGSAKNPHTASSVTGCNRSDLEACTHLLSSSQTSPVLLGSSPLFNLFAQSYLSTFPLAHRPRRPISISSQV